ncbi:uncharacterized mitochondrial protein AtMg00300-like [Salvia splendens]|uniref:uncharacterized mitochondrial protein AtMg00300-like n=1 Tax=Salvia splendens TaxID=180675 RepID=UPI001C253799|nr:uncharacterized mitochondrial protein AtMg00300-like [Salvia splendens]
MLMEDGSHKILSEVRYIPSIKRNPISLGMLEKKGFTTILADGFMKVLKGNDILMVAESVNNLYYIRAEALNADQINVVTKLKLIDWHNRLGHPGFGGLKELAKKGLIALEAGLDEEELRSCEECILAKSKKMPYATGKHT